MVTSNYYTLGGAKVAAPVKGINIVRSVLSDGTVKIRKILRIRSYQSFLKISNTQKTPIIAITPNIPVILNIQFRNLFKCFRV